MPTKAETWKAYKESVVSKLTHQQVYGQVKNQKPGSDGWIIGLCPFHDDRKQSFAFHSTTLEFCCFAGCGKGSAFDFLMHVSGQSFKDTLVELGALVGIPLPAIKPKHPPIDEKLVKKWIQYLWANEEIVQYLREKRGLLDETIKKYEIGWDKKKGRYAFPVRDARGNVVNVRLYNAKKNPKIINYTDTKHKYGSPARLYGLPDLVQYKDKQVILCEGEWDRLLLQQEGFMAVTGTHGAGTFRPEWVDYFSGKDVVIIFDCDKEGQKAVNKIILKAFKNSKVNFIKNVVLPLKGEKDDKDITDYLHKRGCTSLDLQNLINKTPIYSYKEEKEAEEVVSLKSFTEIEQKKYIDKKIQCDITVCGETSEAFHAVEEFKVKFCPKTKKGECFNCIDPIEVPRGAREYIGCCMTTDVQLISMLRAFCCEFGQRPSIEITKRTTVKEFFCHQKINQVAQDQEIMEKKVYFLSSTHPKPGSYRATGWVKSHPKTQMVTFLIETMEPLEDDFSRFRIEDNLDSLRAFQALSWEEILNHLTNEVTGIYERDEILTAILLTYCSPRWIPFNQETIRGWLVSVIIGDAGAGKSQTYQKIANYIGIGDCFSALTGSRTGLAYALVEHPQKGWQVKIGRYPGNSRKLLIVDEGQFLPESDWRTISIAMETGFLKIDRVTSRGYESQTRLIMIANPKKDQIMDSFTFGCEALSSLFPPTLIRRTDLAIFVNSGDIKDTSIINKKRSAMAKPVITPKMLRAVIYWTWNLKPEQIIFEPEAESFCLQQATELSKLYGFATDIPLITLSDTRNNLARIATAFAALLVSSSEDFSKLIVKEVHVQIAIDLIKIIYSHESCGLDGYSEVMKASSQLTDYELIEKTFLDKWKKEKYGSEADYFPRTVYLLYTNKSIRRDDLIEQVGCSKEPIQKAIQLFKRYNLIDSFRSGYTKKPKFNKFLRRFTKNHIEFFEGAKQGHA